MQDEDQKTVAKLTQEQKAKAAAAKTPEEMLAFAQEEGVILTDEQLEAISGGFSWNETFCPQCYGNLDHWMDDSQGPVLICKQCGWMNRERSS